MTDIQTLSRLQNEVKDAAYELLKAQIGEGATRIRPLFPYCVVYVLPRDRMSRGGIVLPDYAGSGAQAKLTEEGIILRVWFGEKKILFKRDGKDCEMTIRSDMQPGDHVLFPHWAGQPLPGESWPDARFRFVKEYTNSGSSLFLDAGGDTIIGKIGSGIDISTELARFISEDPELLLKEFVVFPRHQGPVVS